MALIIDPRTGVVHRYVFELRYELGQTYWDRAGRIARSVIAAHDQWDFDTIDIQRCQISRRDQNITFNFGPAKLDLSQTQNADVVQLISTGEFGKIAESMAKQVVDALELEHFPRIGFRAWYLYPTNNRANSHDLLRNLKLVRLDSESTKAIGTASELSFRLIVDRGTHMSRIAVAGFEQSVDLPESVVRASRLRARREEKSQHRVLLDQLKAKKIVQSFPQFGVLFDVDTFIDDPPYPDSLSISNFITTAIADIETIRPLVLEAATRN